MTPGVQIVRLLAATAVAFGSCFFVTCYDKSAYVRYSYDHPNADGHRERPGQELILEHRSIVCEWITAYRAHAYAVPTAGLLLGILFIWRWPKVPVLIELVVAFLWLLALMWAGLVLIAWQIQNIPIFFGMRLHY